jgi:hypothetical protein
MAVYVDNFNAKFQGMIMCHVIADSQLELLEFMDKIGVQRKWIQYINTYNEHFDICLSKKKKAISLGAIEINFRDYANMVNERNSTGKMTNPNKTLFD